jgi:LPXTG-site transpeptidase (sortase) family protein
MKSDIKEKPEKSLARQIIDAVLYLVACLLIFGGLAVLIWILRPYATLYLMPSAKANLEKKANSGKVTDNRIIIPSVLVDAPIMEEINRRSLHEGVAHDSDSVSPGEKGNCIIEGHNLAEFGLFQPRSFFSLLELARIGAPVYVFYNGKKYTYEVVKKKKLDVSNPKLRENTSGERLTLITCVSTWSATIYTSKRTVVICKPAEKND